MNRTFEFTFSVTETLTAAAMGSGDLPVLATPAMVAGMENAARQCVAPLLAEGDTTVGVRIDVEHKKASPLGSVITARATLDRQEGRTFHFSVEAYEGDTLIGSGAHTRVSVNAERFLAKLQK